MLEDPRAMIDFAQHHLQSQANVSLNNILKQWEKAYTVAALNIAQGNVSRAARILNVNRTTLHGRMQLLTDSEAE